MINHFSENAAFLISLSFEEFQRLGVLSFSEFLVGLREKEMII